MSEAAALLLSIAIEAVVAAFFAKITRWSAPALAALAATLGTLVTHPLVWNGVEAGSEFFGYWPALFVAESGAVVLEALGYRLLATASFFRALVFSAAANGVSLGVGLTLYAFDIV